MSNPIKKTFAFLWKIIVRLNDDDLSYRAASLVYNSLLSMVPFAIVMLTMLSLIPAFHGVGESIQHFVFQNFVSGSAQTIVNELQHFMAQMQHLSWITTIFLVITAVFMMTNINQAFDAIWHVKNQRSFLVMFAIYFFFVIIGPILIGSGVVISSFLISLPFVSAVHHIPYVTNVFVYFLPYIFTWITFTLMNWLIPSCPVKFWCALVGGLVSTILFELLKWGFGLYVAYSTTYQALYGALAIIPLFLLWLYCCWLVILIGVVVSHEMSRRPTVS